MRKSPGFTLIEMMIVVCIIAIVVAITLPSLLQTRLRTNETSAVENLRTVCTSEIGYHAAHGTFGDFENLTDNADEDKPFLDESWAQDVVEKSGYVFNVDSFSSNNFACYADPKVEGTTGRRYFSVDASGVIRYAVGDRPTETSDPIE